MTDVPRLPPRERAAQFRRLAEDAAKFAKSSTGPIRQAYELIAEQWLKLAEEIESQFNKL